MSDLEPSPVASEASSRRARVVFLSVSAAVVAVTLALAHEVLFPFVLAVLVAYVLTPLVSWVESLRMRRWIAVLVVYAATLGVLGGSLRLVAPRLGQELQALLRDAPHLVDEVQNEILPRARRALATRLGVSLDDVEREPAFGPTIVAPPPPEPDVRLRPKPDGSYELDFGVGVEVRQTGEGRWRIEPIDPIRDRAFETGSPARDVMAKAVAYGQKNALEVLKLGREIVRAVSRAIFVFFMTLMLGAYLMLTRERVTAFFRSLVAVASQASFDRLLARIDRGLSGVVRGQLVICVVNGVLSAIGFAIFGLKYWPILAIVAGVMSLVPIFGSILSSVPIVAIALTQSFATAVAVLLWIVGIHQIEANLLNPKIMGDAAKIHPVLVVLSLLAGEHFFGVSGALLAVPVLSIAQSVFLHFRSVVYGDDAPPSAPLRQS